MLDQNGTVLTSSMQARLSETQNINTQVVGETYFHTLDITHLRARYSTCKFLAIRMYAHSKTSCPINNGGYQGYLKMLPLTILGHVELIQEKFASVPPNEVILNNVRLSHQRRIGTLSNIGIIHKNNSFHSTTKYFRQLTFQESPWLECTTTLAINAIQLEVQDE